MYPVEVRYDPLDRDLEEKGDITYIDAAVRAVDDLNTERQRGDILIFMPTEQDIRETCELLKGGIIRDEASSFPCSPGFPGRNSAASSSRRASQKIIVATNVAETSITIPGIRYVIDTGLARISQYNPRTRTTGLPDPARSRAAAPISERAGAGGSSMASASVFTTKRITENVPCLPRRRFCAPISPRSS